MLLAAPLSSPIAQAFSRISAETTLQASDHQAFSTHETRVCRSIASSLGVVKFVRIGSYERGSAVRGTSDMDILAVLRRDEVTWGGSSVDPRTTLERVRQALRLTFPNTLLGRDGQAIVVEFADGRSIDVAPGWYDGPISSTNGWPLYQIPSGGSSWLATAPDHHNSFIAAADKGAGGKLKTVVRILKYWRLSRSEVPLSAFHLELLLSANATCVGARSLARCVADALALLQSRSCRALQDPCGISGYIQAAATEAKRERLTQTVNASAEWAAKALSCEAAGDNRNALYYWNLVFNGQFA